MYYVKCLFHIYIDNNSIKIMDSEFNCYAIQFYKLKYSGSTR